ncbi:hypothetical protein DP113_03515 [Brasilonema octagenarum UFV-E1]|uniref:Uncharacterized protein n=2 Tax=Brasilonema TaxID=383614 RepID=A0A856MDJ7_9CYAN|nr:hypothetical protein DP114_03560 [Brasilonema sennae CENA114]QDL13471.1 hypothetical protein DP113_03515 [Brasilonema octagenarum UFV-E1]
MLSAIEMAIAEDATQATSVQVVAVRQRGRHMPLSGNPPMPYGQARPEGAKLAGGILPPADFGATQTPTVLAPQERRANPEGVNNLTCIDQIEEFQPWDLQASNELQEIIYCPLTLCLPENLVVPFEGIIKACRDIPGLRHKLTQHTQVAIGNGSSWLPVVLTAYGPLYGEAITLADEFNGKKLPDNLLASDLTYYQPLHLSDVLRQSLYHMAHNLLQLLLAPPATYLIQFGLEKSEICFDRLWPFPTAPALASVGVQKPDLFTCHWYCLTAKPILDLNIIPIAQSGFRRL